MGWSTTDISKLISRKFKELFVDLQQIKELLTKCSHLLIEINEQLKEKK